MLCAVVLYYTQVFGQQGVFELLPSPQEFKISGSSRMSKNRVLKCFSATDTLPIGLPANAYKFVNKKSTADLVFLVDKALDLPKEGYVLDILDRRIAISAKDEAGLFYAFATLSQLLEDARQQNVSLPICKIKDYPKIAYRPIHLDLKHHIEKTAYYYTLIDRLASYKVNAIIIEFEDKLKYRAYPLVGVEDALPVEVWQKLSAYAHQRHIAISPLVQGLGHASFILKHPQYESLRDDPSSDWAFNPLDSRTYDLQFALYDQAIAATPYGEYLHVGADEVHTTGRNSGKSSLDLELIWLEKVSEYLAKKGRTPIFWDDMPLKFTAVYETTHDASIPKHKTDSIWAKNAPELDKFLKKIPKNMLFMRWNYDTPNTYGNKKAIAYYKANKMPIIGATAGQMRTVLMPLFESNIENIKTFASVAINNGIDKLFLTLWDDDSPLFEMHHRSILAFAEYAWGGTPRTKEQYKAAYRHRTFANALSDQKYAFIDSLEKSVAFWKNELLEGDARNYLKSNKNPSNSLIDLPFYKPRGKWSEKYKDRLSQAKKMKATNAWVAQQLRVSKEKAVYNIFLLEVYEVVNEITSFSTDVLLYLELYDNTTSELEKEQVLGRLKELPIKFRNLVTKIRDIYGRIRVLDKPESYILDQDHHVHLANQAKRFEDWQFYAETLFLNRLKEELNHLKQ